MSNNQAEPKYLYFETVDSFNSGIKDNGNKWRYVLYFCFTA
jgi:hypothetical protein